MMRGKLISWKRDIMDMKQRLRGGRSNYPGAAADFPYLGTAHLSCHELNVLSEVQFIEDNDAAKQRANHYRDLKRNAKCLGVNPR